MAADRPAYPARGIEGGLYRSRGAREATGRRSGCRTAPARSRRGTTSPKPSPNRRDAADPNGHPVSTHRQVSAYGNKSRHDGSGAPDDTVPASTMAERALASRAALGHNGTMSARNIGPSPRVAHPDEAVVERYPRPRRGEPVTLSFQRPQNFHTTPRETTRSSGATEFLAHAIMGNHHPTASDRVRIHGRILVDETARRGRIVPEYARFLHIRHDIC